MRPFLLPFLFLSDKKKTSPLVSGLVFIYFLNKLCLYEYKK
ncbi:hypothetical protein B4144_4280 [Bacillus atrophaeus]|nr:hypothetical protein B4144_4280 [Bacillus atrophaeus]